MPTRMRVCDTARRASLARSANTAVYSGGEMQCLALLHYARNIIYMRRCRSVRLMRRRHRRLGRLRHGVHIASTGNDSCVPRAHT